LLLLFVAMLFSCKAKVAYKDKASRCLREALLRRNNI
jgi:hypothetical protein